MIGIVLTRTWKNMRVFGRNLPFNSGNSKMKRHFSNQVKKGTKNLESKEDTTTKNKDQDNKMTEFPFYEKNKSLYLTIHAKPGSKTTTINSILF